MSDEKLPVVRGDELSNEGHFALWYSLAIVLGGDAEKLFKAADAKMKMSASDKKAALQKGLNELAEKGIISLARNGLGEYEPAQVHVRIQPDTGLIVRDGQ